MFTSHRGGSVWKRTALIYGALAVFCGVFAVIYLQFSHGESSPFLVWLFAPALVLGAIPALLMTRTKPAIRPGIAVRKIWNTAIATLSCGMLVRAIINISGRYTEYDLIYWIVSGILFVCAAALAVCRAVQRKKAQNRAAEDATRSHTLP